MDQHRLERLLDEGLGAQGNLTVLTGAGISAESGIPTFRGPQGYWTVGSKVYHPQEMASFHMFQRDPRAVWQWYLYRYGVCRQASPNRGHYALVELERLLPERFILVTQNVDNLHLRAGQSPARTYQIHGNIQYVRCAEACDASVRPMPVVMTGYKAEQGITEEQWRALHCERCGHLLRPHVLWFDEMYNESYYRLESTLDAARHTAVLFIVGTSGATNLPNQVVSQVYGRGGVIIDINTEPNRFSRFAERYDRGMAIRQKSGTALPAIVQTLAKSRRAKAP